MEQRSRGSAYRTAHASTSQSVVRCTWRHRGSLDDVEELVAPPVLPVEAVPLAAHQSSADEKMHTLFGEHQTKDPVGHQQRVGIHGSRRKTRAEHVHVLAYGGSSVAEGIPPRLMPLVYGLCWNVANEHTFRMLSDRRWCDAFAAAAARAAAPVGEQAECGRPARVCVFGLGSGVPAMAAARAGAQVLWVERVQRFAQVARDLLARNGHEAAVQVVAVREWSDLTLQDGGRFDAVVTELLGDDLLADGLLTIARHAAALLPPRPADTGRGRGRDPLAPPRFVPARARIRAVLLSLRATRVAGFDLRGFNAFRSNEAVWVDSEHLEATDAFGTQRATRLSEPFDLFGFELEEAASIPRGGRAAAVGVAATGGGVLNALAFWSELELGGAGALGGSISLDLGPDAPGAPRPYWRRARGQRVVFLGYERTLRRGDTVRVTAAHDDDSVRVDAPADGAAEAAGALVRWPQAPSLAYHWPMIADEGRNSAFDRALGAAISAHAAAHGGAMPRVLDIGAGSGLLAMMAARHGATEVTSLEMVPALAAAARHIVAANGFSSRVRVVGKKSTELTRDEAGGAAELLVCEIVDDQLLGEGVLATVADARRRLLAPNARVVPSGAAVFALAVELRPPARAGFALDDFGLFACDQALCPRAHTGCKLQHLDPAEYRVLAPEVRLFDWDWQRAPVDELVAPRSVELGLDVAADGLITAFLVYFRLRCDESNTYSSGPENARLVAWDQNLRFLPVQVRVRKGMRLRLRAEHDEQLVRVGLPELSPDMVAGSVGHVEQFLPR